MFSLEIGAQSAVSSHLHRLNEIKAISDPMDRDTQLIWQYNFISEELARHKDERTQAYLDTLKTLVNNTAWDNGLGFYYRAMGRYFDFGNLDGEKALEYYQKAIEAYKPAGGDTKELAFTYVLKGFFLNNSGLPDEAWKVLEEGLPYARQTASKNSLCLILDFFGDYYYYPIVEGKQDYNKALEYYIQVNDIIPKITNPGIIADNHAVLSGSYYALGDIKQADHHFEIADSIFAEHQLPHTQAAMYKDRALALVLQGKKNEAENYFIKVEEAIKNTNNLEFLARFENSLYEFYKDKGNYKKALSHYEAHTSMENEIGSNDVKKKYKEIESKYNVAVKDAEIQELKQSSLKNIRNFLLALVGILIGAAFLIWNKNRALQKSYSALEEKQNEVEQAIYKGETQERQRVASELHDNVNTKLAAARWRLEAIIDEVKGPSKEIVAGTIDMMNEAYQDVRHVSHNLVPDQLENEGLVASIDNLLRKLNSNGGLKFSLEADNIQEPQIKKLIYPIYNIIFELINNVMKHADASESLIQIQSDDNNLEVIIQDNGQGFDVDKMQKGYGLRSISTRVSALDGSLHVSSALGQGTETRVEIPITKSLVNV